MITNSSKLRIRVLCYNNKDNKQLKCFFGGCNVKLRFNFVTEEKSSITVSPMEEEASAFHEQIIVPEGDTLTEVNTGKWFINSTLK
jgi:hypothetical protein